MKSLFAFGLPLVLALSCCTLGCGSVRRAKRCARRVLRRRRGMSRPLGGSVRALAVRAARRGLSNRNSGGGPRHAPLSDTLTPIRFTSRTTSIPYDSTTAAISYTDPYAVPPGGSADSAAPQAQQQPVIINQYFGAAGARSQSIRAGTEHTTGNTQSAGRSARKPAELLPDRLQKSFRLCGARLLGGRQDTALRHDAEYAQSGIARSDRSGLLRRR